MYLKKHTSKNPVAIVVGLENISAIGRHAPIMTRIIAYRPLSTLNKLSLDAKIKKHACLDYAIYSAMHILSFLMQNFISIKTLIGKIHPIKLHCQKIILNI